MVTPRLLLSHFRVQYVFNVLEGLRNCFIATSFINVMPTLLGTFWIILVCCHCCLSCTNISFLLAQTVQPTLVR